MPIKRAMLNRVLFDYQRNARRRGLEWTLTKEEFSAIIFMACVYCGADPMPRLMTGWNWKTRIPYQMESIERFTGVDRVDNTLGYVAGNCIPCCVVCNSAKGTRSQREFYDHLERIVEHKGDK